MYEYNNEGYSQYSPRADRHIYHSDYRQSDYDPSLKKALSHSTPYRTDPYRDERVDKSMKQVYLTDDNLPKTDDSLAQSQFPRKNHYSVDSMDYPRNGDYKRNISREISRETIEEDVFAHNYRNSSYDLHNRSNISSRDHLEANLSVGSNRNPPDVNNLSVLSTSSQNYLDQNRSILSRDQPDLNRSAISSRDQLADVNRSAISSRDPLDLNRSTMSTHETNDLNRSTVSQRVDLNRSNLSHRTSNDISHSILSRDYRDYNETDFNKSVASHRERDDDMNRSTLSRNLDLTHSSQSGLTHQIKTEGLIPTHKQNGIARPISDGILFEQSRKSLNGTGNLARSRRSLNLSRPSLNLSRVTLYGKDYGVQNSLINLGFMALLALVVAIVGILLIFRLNSHQNTGAPPLSILNNSTRDNMMEVTVALTSFVVVLDLCCVMVCAMQCFFAAKLLKTPQGEDRAFKYLKDCAGTRFISITGFFISLPTVIVCILLYMLMEFRATPAIISTVIMCLGFLFIVVTVIHNTYRWRAEKSKADKNIPVKKTSKDTATSQSELSTLV